ncbi:MAG: low-specificity L-threonine aldolase [Chlorobi bacterium]|nr:low-specificity L-threonine aldolase [Chlorobiota bacterium]MCI0715465.1 low-specificity L-threonine aldolase [Chlorobiota bacterium]
MNFIDLRSDTVTRPSKAMREAMANAEVGDDVFGDDPTVNKLQQKCAEFTGKQDSLFVPSGCMANQLAIKCHTNPSDEIIVEWDSHIIKYENSAPAFISGVQLMPLKGKSGVMVVSEIQAHIRPDWYHFPKTSLICLENTHNRAGGTIYPLDEIKKVRELALKRNIKTHLDGARIFNAVVETGVSLKEYSAQSDSVSFCFSKGLGAPVGSILCGDSEFIDDAHRFRKVLCGGMRQAGIIAAGALFALENNIERLKDDHKKARRFAEGISKLDFAEVDLSSVQTNIVIFKTKINADELKSVLEAKGVLVTNEGPDKMRVVFHMDISDEQTSKAIGIFKSIN